MRVSVGLCFARAGPARRSRLRRSAILGRSDGAALRATFGVGQRFALPWGAFGVLYSCLGLGFEILGLGFEVVGRLASF